MDYCSECHRHLNGALVCPGCGAYAPDIAPTARRSRRRAPATATIPEAYDSGGFPASELRSAAAHTDTAASADGIPEAAQSVPSSDEEAAIPLAQGRAARRRQLARWKKSRRRAGVATAIALLGGGLTVTAISNGSSKTHSDTASAAPDTSPQDTAVVRGANKGDKTDDADARSVQPDERVSRHHHGSDSATTSSPQRKTEVNATDTTTANSASTAVVHSASRTATTSHSSEGTAPKPSTTTGTAQETDEQAADTSSPQTAAPAPSESTGSSTSTTKSSPLITVSPEEVCLLVACVR